MKNELSILIPTYNDVCVDLVKELARQCETFKWLQYEILVADDGSTDAEVKKQNSYINNIYRCKYVERGENTGRASIRNWLAHQARHEWLLYVDSDMSVCKDDFIAEYLDTDDYVVYGGYVVKGDKRQLKGNLRYMYEKKAEPFHTIKQRILSPYQDFHTSNFLIARQVIVTYPLDGRFRNYGYEDVLYGKQLQRVDVPICHILNPVAFEKFEDNAHFVAKTEEGLRTLHTFQTELKGYVRLLDAANKYRQHRFLCLLLMWVYRHRKDSWRKKLCGKSPSLFLFKLYKLCYFLELG